MPNQFHPPAATMRHGPANSEKAPSQTSDSVLLNRQADLESDSHSDDDQENDPATHSGKRKRPTSVSCELCKQRKVKCDRGQPSCGWCSRNGATCEYKERRRPGLRAGFGKELQERMDKLELILQSHSDIIQNALGGSPLFSVAASVRNSNSSLPSDQGTPREAAPANLYRTSEPISTQQGESGVFLQKPASFAPTSQNVDYTAPQPVGLAENVHHQQLTVAGLLTSSQVPPIQPSSHSVQSYYVQNQSALETSAASLQRQAAPTSADQDMPPYDLLYALVDLYFKHIHSWCPILYRKTTLDSLFGPSTLQEADRILLHAIIATTMRFSTDPRLTDDRRRHYHKVCKDRVILYGMENTSVKSLQALVILALDIVGSSNGPPGWNILALITRSVVQLGLAVESNSFSVSPSYTSIYTLRAMILPETKDFIEDESRRRLFWMVYLLDRYTTITTAFEFGLADKEIDRTLPCRDDLWMQNQKVDTKWFKTRDHHGDAPAQEICQPENLGPFAHYIEILGILSKIHTFLKQPVDIGAHGDVERWQLRYREMDHLLSSWRCGLSAEFGDMSKLFQAGSKNPNCILVMLHATYHTAVIRLHSSAAYPTTRSPIFTSSYSASQRCHSAVEHIATLGEFVVQNGLLIKLGPPFAWTVWVSARLLLVHGSTVERKLSPKINFFVDTLRDMGRYWPVAARYCGLLSRVLDEHRESEQKGDGVTPNSVRILADMRRTAFDLDFLISRQPRHGTGPTIHLSSVASSRTPGPNELEYLEMFDFFNVPRLPFGGVQLGGPNQSTGPNARLDVQHNGQKLPSNEFNITNFMVDAKSDWFKEDGGNFMTNG